jgi:putative aldouronate transport system substrate-binding protein
MAAPVEVSYIYPGGIPSDLATVEEALNGLLKDRGVNATIVLTPVDWGSYTDKVNLMVAAGEECDLLFVAPWLAPSYAQLIANGALLPLNDMLDMDAAELVASLPTGALDATTVNGNIYGIPNQQIWVKPFGPVVRQDLADTYEFDISTITDLAGLEPFLSAVAANETDTFPATSGAFVNEVFGWDPIVTQDAGVVVRFDDGDLTVFNGYASPEFADHVALMRAWYDAGYFPLDEVPGEDFNNLWQTGRFGSSLFEVVQPDISFVFEANRGFPVYAKALAEPFMSTASVSASMNAVCQTSESPAEALQILNLLNTDVEFYNTLAKGVEGKHWVWVDQAANVIGPGPDADGYAPGTDWMFGNVFNAFYNDPALAEQDITGQTAALNAAAPPSVALGFTFDPDPVKNELAQVSAVVSEIGVPLYKGETDPAETLPEFLDALEGAGIGRIIEEAQAQLNAWAGR